MSKLKVIKKTVPLFPLIPIVPAVLIVGSLVTSVWAMACVRRLERRLTTPAPA
jgi:hypothetical protein